ncbi:hypothetical protein ANO11243_094510 [Dothideomycetidae sp. 11243]|nr:hypothetical protein ANO11243_094510 [fungal sp. No.11243]
MAPFPSPTKIWHSETYPSLSPARPELSAANKTVLITGVGTGIGAETARYFARAGAARIALLGRREQPLIDTKADIEKTYPGVEVFVAATDVTDSRQVDAAFAKFVGNAKLDVLVHAAAMIGPQDPIKDVDLDKFAKSIDTNIRGSLAVAQAFLRHAADEAVAIEINSSAAHVNFVASFAAYSVAKMAVFRLWDSLAFASPNIRVYHVQPGVVATDMNREAGGVEALGFEDNVNLPASFNVWLASPEARFLKGRFLWANWDVDELKARSAEIEAGQELSLGLGGWPFAREDYKFQAHGSANSAWST